MSNRKKYVVFNRACPSGSGYAGLRFAAVLRTAPCGSTLTIPHARGNLKMERI